MTFMIPSLNLKKTKKKLIIAYSAMIAMVLVFTSCVDENNQIGLNFVKSSGGMDVLSANDHNTQLSAKTYYSGDSLETAKYDNFVLGSYKDQYFGKIIPSIYTSLILPDSYIDMPNIGTVDSVVLCLSYAGAFAKDSSVKSMTMKVDVFELSEKIDTNKKYSSDSFATKSYAIFSGNVLVNPSQSVIINNDTLNPHLRLKITGDFFNRIKNAQYSSKEEFQEAFKGLKITAKCSDNNGMLAYINMKSNLSGLRVYYHAANEKSKYLTLGFPTSTGKLMHLNYDYSGSNLAGLNTKTRTKDTVITNDYIYLACLGIAENKINIEGLMSWYNQDSIKGAVINRAELILPVADINPNNNTIPASINCFRKENGKFYYISDEIASYNWLGNKYDPNIKAYRLDITSFLQNYLIGTYPDCVLYLVPDGRMSTAKRVILSGPNSNNKPKLNIIYSHPATN